jgi:outer membrane protein
MKQLITLSSSLLPGFGLVRVKNRLVKDMNPIGQKIIWFNFAVMATLLLAGCVSSEKYYEDVSLSREVAYRQWAGRKERQQRSETYISGELSIEDCLKLALVNNKVLQSVLQEKQIARGERLKSYSVILPDVDLTAEYLRKDQVGSLGPITFGDLDNYSTSLKVTQPIFAGGSIPATINAGRLFSLLTDQTVRAAVQDLTYTAGHSYYDVLLNQHLVQISADAVRSAQAHLDSVKQRREGGVASDFDVLRAEVELSNFQAELIRNKNAINIAKAQLIKVMGVSQDSNFVLSDELQYNPSEMTMERAVEAAFRNRPDLMSGEFDIKYQKELLKINRSRYWPTLSGFYDNIWSRPDPHQSTIVDDGHLWQAGFRATLPIFDGFSREGEIIQQKARVRQAQIDLIDTEETALFEITSALLSIEDAAEFVESQRLNLTRAEEGLRLAEVGYREGINTQVEMIDAQAALTTASANYYQAIYSHIIAKLDLQKAMGILAMVKADKSEGKIENDELKTAKETASVTLVSERQSRQNESR